MTKQQLDKVYKVVEENEWVAKLANNLLEEGQSFTVICEQIADAFNIK